MSEIKKVIVLNDGSRLIDPDGINNFLERIKIPAHQNPLELLMQIELSPEIISIAMLHVGKLEISHSGETKDFSLFQKPDLEIDLEPEKRGISYFYHFAIETGQGPVIVRASKKLPKDFLNSLPLITNQLADDSLPEETRTELETQRVALLNEMKNEVIAEIMKRIEEKKREN